MPLPRRPPRPRAGTAPRSARARATRRAATAAPASPWSRRALTSRAAILALVICAVLLSLAYPLREYFAQRAEIDRLAAQQRETTQRVAALRREQQRWHDPAYVKSQARQRLHFVLPGETAYVVLDPNRRGSTAPKLLSPVQPDVRGQPWYVRLWRSVEAAEDGRR